MSVTIAITTGALFGGAAASPLDNLDVNLRAIRAAVVAAGSSKVSCVVPPLACQLGSRIQSEMKVPHDPQAAIELGLEHVRRRLRYAHKLEIVTCDETFKLPQRNPADISIPIVVSTGQFQKLKSHLHHGQLAGAMAASLRSSAYLLVCSVKDALPGNQEKKRMLGLRNGIPTVLDGRDRNLLVAFCNLERLPALLDHPPKSWSREILL